MAMKKRNLIIAALIAASLICTVPCFGLVSGTVTDMLGKAVSAATVSFTDESNPARSMFAVTDGNGKYQIDIATSVNDNSNITPKPFNLGQNYPNPFNPTTTIPFFLDQSGYVNLTIYNILGQRVCTLVDTEMNAGAHSVVWDSRSDNGISVGAGIYLYQIKYCGKVLNKKMLLLDGGDSKILGLIDQRNGRNRVISKPAKTSISIKYSVSILSSEIQNYFDSGITIVDGKTCDFIVIRKTGNIVLDTQANTITKINEIFNMKGPTNSDSTEIALTESIIEAVEWLKEKPAIEKVEYSGASIEIEYTSGKTGGILFTEVNEDGKHISFGSGSLNVSKGRVNTLGNNNTFTPMISSNDFSFQSGKILSDITLVSDLDVLVWAPFEKYTTENYRTSLVSIIKASERDFHILLR